MNIHQRVQQLQQELWEVDDRINAELEKRRDCDHEALPPHEGSAEGTVGTVESSAG